MEPLLRTDLTSIPSVTEIGSEWAKLPLADQRYDIGPGFAQGGMGCLHTATDKALGRKVGIKLLSAELRDDQTAVTRFFQEARIHAQFHHQSIPPLHDVGRLADGRPFIAMKFIRGRTVSSRLDDPTPPEADPSSWWRKLFNRRVM